MVTGEATANSLPLVSVVIPVYNGDRYLAQAVESVLEQDYRPLEIIVVDDGSTDRSAEIARSYAQIRYLYQANQGAAGARNTGIDASRGVFVAFLDHDDLWTPDKLRVHVGYLLDHPDVGYTVSTGKLLLDEHVERPAWLRLDDLDRPQPLLGTLVVRRSVFQRVGVFDTSFKVAEDTQWLMRANDVGLPLTVLPEVVVLRRVHDGNLTSTFRAQHRHSLLRGVHESIRRKRQVSPRGE